MTRSRCMSFHNFPGPRPTCRGRNRLRCVLPPWRCCSGRWLNRRRVIVELGSGVSTVFLARLLRNEGGHLYTVEDDEAWAAHVARWLEQEGTTDRVTLIRAPVED